MSENVIQYLISPQCIPHIQEKYCNISYFGFHDWTLLTMAEAIILWGGQYLSQSLFVSFLLDCRMLQALYFSGSE